jgi:crotonobetainyl-CoA:carnitine CoA-transferase CaiB-like acyl-CoA transferase
VNETGLVEEIEHPRLGRLRVIANPIRMGAVAGHSVRTPPPALGEHSRQVLRDFGLGEARIDALQSAKVILDAR